MHDKDGTLCTSSWKCDIISVKCAQNFSIFSEKLPNIWKISCSIYPVCLMIILEDLNLSLDLRYKSACIYNLQENQIFRPMFRHNDLGFVFYRLLDW